MLGLPFAGLCSIHSFISQAAVSHECFFSLERLLVLHQACCGYTSEGASLGQARSTTRNGHAYGPACGAIPSICGTV